MNRRIMLFGVVLMIAPSFLFAATSSNYTKEMGSKLGRGIENFVTSPAEIPCATETEMHQGDRIIRFFTGVTKGTVLFLRSAVVGVTEGVTFFVPMERILPRVCTESVSNADATAQPA